MPCDDAKLAFCIPSGEVGGAERVTALLASEFAKSGCDVDLVIAKSGNEIFDSLHHSVNVVQFDKNRLLTAVPDLILYLRRNKPSTLYSAMTHMNAISLIARRIAAVSTNIVISEHGLLSAKRRDMNMLGNKLFTNFLSALYKESEEIIAVSRDVKYDLSSELGLNMDDITVIYNPVLDETMVGRQEEPVTHPWVKSDRPLILGVGRLDHRKDFETLIEAIARIRTPVDARLIILGEGNHRAQLERKIDALNLNSQVELLGYVENPLKYMSKCNVFVSSSHSEGFGNVIVEALFCGTPVVATDCLGGPSEILEQGKYGLIVPTGDPTALARAVEFALKAECDSEQLHRRSLDFTAKKIAKRYEEVLGKR